mmetsp:Transcript_40009/g.125682  ORF Transcript_40009/g.125682 Transcript_40009/m.125682 type:complete len:243 (-) Transcript_40009:1048-1776(-)
MEARTALAVVIGFLWGAMAVIALQGMYVAKQLPQEASEAIEEVLMMGPAVVVGLLLLVFFSMSCMSASDALRSKCSLHGDIAGLTMMMLIQAFTLTVIAFKFHFVLAGSERMISDLWDRNCSCPASLQCSSSAACVVPSELKMPLSVPKNPCKPCKNFFIDLVCTLNTNRTAEGCLPSVDDMILWRLELIVLLIGTSIACELVCCIRCVCDLKKRRRREAEEVEEESLLAQYYNDEDSLHEY